MATSNTRLKEVITMVVVTVFSDFTDLIGQACIACVCLPELNGTGICSEPGTVHDATLESLLPSILMLLLLAALIVAIARKFWVRKRHRNSDTQHPKGTRLGEQYSERDFARFG